MGVLVQPSPTETADGSACTPVPAGRLRARAIILGAVLVIPTNAWVILMEKVRNGPFPTVFSLFVHTLFILTVLTGLNALVRRVRPAWSLSTAELLVIYTMVTISSALAGHDMLPTLVAHMSYPWYRADELWNSTFIPSLPTWLSVTDARVVDPLYKGGSSLFADGNWRPWVLPSLYWTAFMSVLIYIMMCLNTLVRRQWIEHERLTFPIVQLPLAMTEPEGRLWKNKLFWISFSICFGIEVINGLAIYMPAIPTIDLGFANRNLGAGLTSLPWSAVGWMPVSFYPFVIGLGYLLPTDLCFSVWFFYLFWKVEKVVGASLGYAPSYDFPYIQHQELGGLLALALVLVWSSRGYLKQVWRRALGEPSELDDSAEPMSYRGAMIGAVAGLVFVSWFMGRIGMSPLVAVAAFVVYLVIAIMIARIRAELGPPIHDMPVNPGFSLPTTLGVGRFSHGDLVGLSYFQAFHGANRAHPMPIGIEGMKMAQMTRASQRRFLWAMVLAGVLGSIATFAAYLYLGYAYGLETGWRLGGVWSHSVSKTLAGWYAPSPEAAAPQWNAGIAMAVGFCFCLLMSYIRMIFFSWPFHPIGFIVSGFYQANLVWAPLLIAWTAKTTILRYGGLKSYRHAMPVFLGLIVGQLTMACIWGIIGIAFGIPYSVTIREW